MATVSSLIALADSLYPNVFSVEDKVKFMNIAQDDLAQYFRKTVEDDTLRTVEDVDTYEYPEGLKDISQIISVGISKTTDPANRYDYTEYKRNMEDEHPMSYNGYYQVVNTNGDKSLVFYPPPRESDRIIIIKYEKKPTRLNAGNLSFEPEFDPRYHDMLSFYCCHMICSAGASPDFYQADMFMAKYDMKLTELWRNKMEINNETKRKRRDNKQWTRGRTFGRGN